MKLNKILKYSIGLLLFVACACNQIQKQTVCEIVIDVGKIITIPFDSLNIKYLQYIPLETNDDVLLSHHISKMLICNDRIYIADYHDSKSLFVFDFQGKLILKINRVGRGPGEYIHFFDFNVTESGDIYLWDTAQSKLIKFGQDGSFQTEVQLSSPLINFMLFPNNRLYANWIFEDGAMSDELAYYNWETGKYHQILPATTSDPFKFLLYTFQHFSQSPYGCYYIPRFSEIAYRLNEEDVIPYIKFENIPLPSKSTIKAWQNDIREMTMDRVSFKDLHSIFETEDYISFVMEFMSPQQMVYQKSTSNCYKINDLKENMGFDKIQACNEDTYFSIILPDVEEALHVIKKNALHMPNKKQLDELHAESNPVIVAFRFETP